MFLRFFMKPLIVFDYIQKKFSDEIPDLVCTDQVFSTFVLLF